MSDHPREAERNLKRICICDDIWLDAFRWLSPAEVGLALALVSDRFDALVDTHLKSRKWALGKWRIIRSAADGTAKIVQFSDHAETVLPIPQMPLPNGVIGFGRIDCRFMSTPVVALLRRIGRLLRSDVTLALGSFFTDHTLSDIFATSIWPLFKVPVPSSSSTASAVVRMCLQSRQVLAQFRTVLSSPSVLRDCANLRLICVSAARLQFPPDDNAGTTDDQAVCKWLHTPRPDGRPKVFGIFSRSSHLPLEELKTEFQNATTSVSFIIVVKDKIGEIGLENLRTRERLTTRQIGDAITKRNWWLIERGPIDDESAAAQWADWGREAVHLFSEEAQDDIGWKMIEFCI